MSWRDDKRKTAERGYGGRWQKARLTHLAKHPLCEMCQAEKPPRITAGTVVDHRIPHKGDQTLFWDRTNWQTLCSTHHNSEKQALERTGHKTVRIGADGWPMP